MKARSPAPVSLAEHAARGLFTEKQLGLEGATPALVSALPAWNPGCATFQ